MSREADRIMQEVLRKQIKSLRSGNKSAILDTLNEIREQGHASILPEVIELMAGQDDADILQSCTSLLNDLKSEDAPAMLAEAIEKPEYRDIHHLLVAACWQNGLSYGAYVDVFLKAAVEGSYETSIEAFSVLEEAVGELELARRQELARQLKHAILDASDEKRDLLRELYRIIDQFQEPDKFTLDQE